MLKFNNKVLKILDKWLNPNGAPVDPYNPLNLPPRTVRVRTSDGNVPIKSETWQYHSATLVPGTTDVYDVFKDSQSFALLLAASTNVVEILGANTRGVTDMNDMFASCSSLTNVALFDTSDVTDMSYMFFHCTSLTNIPLFNTIKATNMNNMFYNCTLVQGGALALYQQASTQANPPSRHAGTFNMCGSNTTTGAEELAQIPEDWKS